MQMQNLHESSHPQESRLEGKSDNFCKKTFMDYVSITSSCVQQIRAAMWYGCMDLPRLIVTDDSV